ncbi:unnamed protein product [Urochloa humidicola]
MGKKVEKAASKGDNNPEEHIANSSASKGKDVVEPSEAHQTSLPNMDRRLMLLGDPPAVQEEDEDEFILEEEEAENQVQTAWLAIARYYSGKKYATRGMFAELSKAWGLEDTTVPYRELRNNRFLIEFNSEQLLNKAVHGGPWKHNFDALIIIPYDGVTRLSDIVIESIPLWVRFYDVPVTMMKQEAFMRALGNKIGRVLEVGVAAYDYKRVKVDFPLEKPLMPMVDMKVRGHGVMEFEAKYENVPHFCFGCGRIGHAQRECPDDHLAMGGVRFGEDLRCSPHKKNAGRQQVMSGSEPRARRGLNFSGEQRERAMSSHSWSRVPRQHATATSYYKQAEEEMHGAAKVPYEVTEELSQGVRNMMKPVIPDLNIHDQEMSNAENGFEDTPMTERVSGLNSYAGSNNGSSTHEKASSIAGGRHASTAFKKCVGKGPGGMKEDLLAQWKVKATTQLEVKEGETPAKRSRTDPRPASNLTGAQGEPCQDQ